MAAIVGAIFFMGASDGAVAAECTDTWIGPAEGAWQTAGNWSAGHTPTESDVACIGSGKTAKVETAQSVGIVQGEGGLLLSNKSLTLTSPSSEAVSSISYLTISGGSLTGIGSLEVLSGLVVTTGSMAGSGSTILASGASGSIQSMSLNLRTLINDGGLILGNKYLSMSNSAKLENMGTFTLNAEGSESGFIHPKGDASALIVNHGTLKKTSGSGISPSTVRIENTGTINAVTGTLELDGEAVALQNGSILEGSVKFNGAPETVVAQDVIANAATISTGASTTFLAEGTTEVGGLTVTNGWLKGNGTVKVSSSLNLTSARVEGSGKTILLPTGTGTIIGSFLRNERTFINEGTTTLPSSHLSMASGARLENRGTFNANAEGAEKGILLGSGAEPVIVNDGAFQKISGAGSTEVQPTFENNSVLRPQTGTLKIVRPRNVPASTHTGFNCKSADPVECATGNFSETQTDFEISGRGVGLRLSRTYSAQAAAILGAFGYGWTNSFSDRLTLEEAGAKVKLTEEDGGVVNFTQSKGSWLPPAWSQYVLEGGSEIGYTLTFPSQVKYSFSGAGRLSSISDRNGNTTILTYDEVGRLKAITVPPAEKSSSNTTAKVLSKAPKIRWAMS
ncbi:MAG: RHS repeat domain-containing protein [Solirubrobacterales bacterium]